MESTSLSLQSIRHAMQEALALQDWGSMRALDSQCRVLIDEAVTGNDEKLRQQLEELFQLYQMLQNAARSERARIVSELTQLSKSKQVNQAYKGFSE